MTNQSLFHDQNDFLKAGNVEIGTITAEALADRLISEEYRELSDEPYYTDDPTNFNTLKEALDLIYVTCQYLNVTIGPDKALECWNLLHNNNMSKCIDGKLVKRADGKIEKPEGYKKADLSEVLGE